MKLFKKSSNVSKNVNSNTQNQQNIPKLFLNFILFLNSTFSFNGSIIFWGFNFFCMNLFELEITIYLPIISILWIYAKSMASSHVYLCTLFFLYMKRHFFEY
jgi:hypothetical protein